jgi:dephospho-CoA kinase
MLVIGLTGGIGMGKSTVAQMFGRVGIPAFNADEAVRKLQAPGGAAVGMLDVSFPGTVRDGVLDRAALRALVLRDAVAMRRLEFLMHPLVHLEEARFRKAAMRAGRRAVLLDIPLLFETGGDRRVDWTVTVSCPRDVQVARVKTRGIPVGQIEAIIAKQMPDGEKRRRADFVVRTGLSKFWTWRDVGRVLRGVGV